MEAISPHGAASAKAKLIENARGLVPKLRERAERASQARTISRETIEDYWSTSLFGILKPKRYGGLEMRFDDFLDVAMELGRGDGSASWVYSVLVVHELMIALYPEELQSEIWSDPRALIASSFAPGAQPKREGNGYRVSGRWSFCSGVDNLSSTVGSEAWNSRDLKSRPH